MYMDNNAQPELVSLAEIADRLKVAPATVTIWRYRHKQPPRPPWRPFPDPVKVAGRSPLFDWADIATWAQATGRMPEKGTTP
jgi:predicted DNA-binding transcriptional regulator AlpA